MLIFLRTIRKSLVDSGATRKYLLYAVGEILLVMIGILLALQVNNWNEDRKDRIEEQYYLEELKREFELNKSILKEEMDFMKRRIEKIDNSLKFMYQPIPDSVNVYELLQYYGTSVPHLEPAEGALNELINSGKLQIVQNRQLRRSLSNWGTKVNLANEHLSKMLKFREDELRPYMIQCCPRGEEFREQHLKVFTDYQFQSLLEIYKQMHNTQIDIKREPLHKLLDQILELLDKELTEKINS